MPATLSRPLPRVFTAGAATIALALGTAAPSLALPGGHGPARECVGCDQRDTTGVLTSSLAGTVSPGVTAQSAGVEQRPVLAAPEDNGATTLAVVLIAAGALLAGASAGFAGGRRTVPHPG